MLLLAAASIPLYVVVVLPRTSAVIWQSPQDTFSDIRESAFLTVGLFSRQSLPSAAPPQSFLQKARFCQRKAAENPACMREVRMSLAFRTEGLVVRATDQQDLPVGKSAERPASHPEYIVAQMPVLCATGSCLSRVRHAIPNWSDASDRKNRTTENGNAHMHTEIHDTMKDVSSYRRSFCALRCIYCRRVGSHFD